jgi:hypothetical protein
MEKITDILLARVEDENGEKYGRVFELRCEGDPEHGITNDERRITSFLAGNHGILQEIGFHPSNVTEIAWNDVIKVQRKKIIIRSPGTSQE